MGTIAHRHNTNVNVGACAVLLFSLQYVVGCQSSNANESSPEERSAIVEELTQALDDYGDAMVRLDLEAMVEFYDDSEDFVFAGDGEILGGHDEWVALLARYNEETEKWTNWQRRNVNVAVLSRDVASLTFEFEYAKINKDGSTVDAHGAWTYVFKRRDGGWVVVHTNGTHIWS